MVFSKIPQANIDNQPTNKICACTGLNAGEPAPAICDPITVPINPKIAAMRIKRKDHFCSIYFTLLFLPYIKYRSEEHTSELQSRFDLVCCLLLAKKKNNTIQ